MTAGGPDTSGNPAVAGARISAADLAHRLGLPKPTAEQAAVIESALGPAAVVAGAGSGKTETMAARVVWLVANRVLPPEQILGLTFTRKAAAELGVRIRRRLAQWRRVVERDSPDDTELLALLQSTEPTVLTYAAYAGRIVAEHALRVGAEPDARLLSPALLWQVSDTVVRRWDAPLPEFKAISSLVHWVIAMSGQFADHLASPDTVEQFCDESLETFFALPIGKGARSELPTGTKEYVEALRQRRALVPMVEEFGRRKRTMGAVDFGDQMTLAAALAKVPAVVEAERARYRAVLLDEYQDTGHAQIEMLRRLFGDAHPVTAVGDPFQSIYGWRGASAGNMGAFDVTFPQADRTPAPVYPLATSFRNDRAILTSANDVAAPLRTSRVTVPLRPHDGAGPGIVATAFTETVEDEAAWVAHRISLAWESLPPGTRTAAVLVRRRSQMQPVADALYRAGLPVEIVGLGGLLTTPEVVDVVATLRVLGDYRAGGALMRLLTGARWRLGPRDLSVLRDRARALVRPPEGADVVAGEREPASLVEALDDLGPAERYSPVGLPRLRRLSAELTWLRRRLGAPLAELVADVEHTIGVGIEVAARPDHAQVGRVHLDRFLDVAAEFAAEAGDASLRAFLAYLEAAEDEENGLEAGDIVVAAERVQLLTVHGAKGLEWDIVSVPGLAGDIFPGKGNGINWARARHELPGPLRGDADSLPPLDLTDAESRKEIGQRLTAHHAAVQERHEQEERRLAYVALTRARSVLLTSGYAWDTAQKPRGPSPYLLTVCERVEPDTWFVPADDAANPRLVYPVTALWPPDPLGIDPGRAGGRRAAVESAAALVRAAISAAPGQTLPGLVVDTAVVNAAVVNAAVVDAAGAGADADPASSAVEPGPPRRDSWRHDVDVLLAERERLRRGRFIDVSLPDRLSVSQLVELHRDPDELARSIHRPLPRPPAPWARRGTAFHTWLEQRWGDQALLDLDELPGAADEGADDTEFVALRAAFEASEWADRQPHEIEVPFEMTIGGRLVRGRMDAVFLDSGVAPDRSAGAASGGKTSDGKTSGGQRWLVVDWKTGRRPTGTAASAAAVQLAAYRLAWARLLGLADDDLHRVRAAFHYVRTDETVEPAALLDADGLRALVAG